MSPEVEPASYSRRCRLRPHARRQCDPVPAMANKKCQPDRTRRGGGGTSDAQRLSAQRIPSSLADNRRQLVGRSDVMVWVRGATRAARTRVMRTGRTTSNGSRMLTGRSSPGLRAVMFVLGAFATCLVLQMVNGADHYELNLKFGLRPGNVQGLLDFVPASFLHLSWNHFEGNGLYLLVVGFFAAYQGIGELLAVTAVVLVTSSLSWWFFGPVGTYSVGASGIICGWIGYGLVGSLYHRKELGSDFVQLLVALYAFAAWQYFWPPWPASTNWRAHVGGLLGGIACGFLLRHFDCPHVLKSWSSQSIKILGIPRESMPNTLRICPHDLEALPHPDQPERDSRDLVDWLEQIPKPNS